MTAPIASARRGIRHVRFSGNPLAAAKLTALGAELDVSTAPVLDLNGMGAPEAACRKFLAGRDPSR